MFNFRTTLFMAMLMTTVSTVISVQGESLGEFQGQTDIGSTTLPGSAKFDTETEEYTVTGSGTNMWFRRDQCHFLWRKMNGDFILRTRLAFVGVGAAEHR